jgi:hypothetical protein
MSETIQTPPVSFEPTATQIFLRRAAHWGMALVNSCVQAGATAAKAFTGTAVASAAHLPVPTMDFKQLGCVFVAAAAYEAFTFLSNTPFPLDDPKQQQIS